MHPSDELRGTKSKKLHGKKIVLGVTGSIAAVECVKLIRELVRHGAGVIPVMTPAAQRIIHPDALEFASEHKPIIQLTGAVEHVAFCGLVADKADAYLICPATANTISKIAYGIDDTPVTTFATTAIGSKIPVIVVPTMHGSMYEHKKVMENIESLKKSGAVFVQPKLEENKAKMPEIEEIVENVIRAAGKDAKRLTGKRILVIGGATAEPIDDVRVITNLSSGKMGVALARAAFEMGAYVEFWYGHGTAPPPKWICTRRFGTVGDLLKLAPECKGFDIILVCAAISDYTVERKKGKISSETVPEIKLKRAPKVLEALRNANDFAIIVPFKLESGVDEKELVRRAVKLLKESGSDMAVANTAQAIGADRSTVLMVERSGKFVKAKGTKDEMAEKIFDIIAKGAKKRRKSN